MAHKCIYACVCSVNVYICIYVCMWMCTHNAHICMHACVCMCCIHMPPKIGSWTSGYVGCLRVISYKGIIGGLITPYDESCNHGAYWGYKEFIWRDKGTSGTSQGLSGSFIDPYGATRAHTVGPQGSIDSSGAKKGSHWIQAIGLYKVEGGARWSSNNEPRGCRGYSGSQGLPKAANEYQRAQRIPWVLTGSFPRLREASWSPKGSCGALGYGEAKRTAAQSFHRKGLRTGFSPFPR
jgi:hypothetical protein